MKRDRGEKAIPWKEQINAGDIAAVIVAGALWLGVMIGLAALVAFLWVAGTRFALSEENRDGLFHGVLCDKATQIEEMAKADDPQEKMRQINVRDGKTSCIIGDIRMVVLEKIKQLKLKSSNVTGQLAKISIVEYFSKDGTWKPFDQNHPAHIQYVLYETEAGQDI